MSLIEIDPASPVPLYLQIAEQMRRLIAMGALEPGDRLPTIRELAVTTRVNRNTAARAIQILEAEVARVDRARTEETIDRAIDRLLVEAHTLGLPLEELGWRLSRRIEAFRRRRAAEPEAVGDKQGDRP